MSSETLTRKGKNTMNEDQKLNIIARYLLWWYGWEKKYFGWIPGMKRWTSKLENSVRRHPRRAAILFIGGLTLNLWMQIVLRNKVRKMNEKIYQELAMTEVRGSGEVS